MLCPACDGEIVSGVCEECGKAWDGAMSVLGKKYNDAVLAMPQKIKTSRDILALIGQLTKIERAYTETIDELTTGGIA